MDCQLSGECWVLEGAAPRGRTRQGKEVPVRGWGGRVGEAWGWVSISILTSESES